VPADYEDLKKKAAKHDEAEEARKSDLERERERAEAAEAAGKAATAQAHGALRRAELMVQAAAQGAVDPDAVIALLSSDESIVVEENGTVKGAKAAVKKLLEEKPYLLAKNAPTRNGGEFGGNDSKSIDEKIREAESAGKWAEARELKMAKALSTS
jgi:hypothetical protein